MADLPETTIRAIAELLIDLTAREVGLRQALLSIPNPPDVDAAIERVRKRITGLDWAKEIQRRPDTTQLEVIAKALRGLQK